MAKKARRQDFDPSFFRGIAHRGLHDETRTENGLAAFQNAIDRGLCFELDIHLTKDDELLVCHDSELERTTGKKGIIEELTLEEIRRDYRLLDGGVVPTYQEVLDLTQEKTLIVTELKTYKGNYKALAKKTMEALAQIKDKKKITIISFDPRALLYCKKGGFTRGLLIYNKRTDIFLVRNFFEYLDLEDCLLQDKRAVSYRKKGGIINTWTIEKEEQLNQINGLCDAITFQHLPVEEAVEFASKL